MLYTQTVSTKTLELLTQLMQDKYMSDFVLVGGTALSLQVGHRLSIDLDLFTTTPFNAEEIAAHLKTNYTYELDFFAKNTLKGEIQGIKVDCITHAYPWINTMIIEQQLRLANMADIAAMKLNTITTNGTRVKDFIDIAYLSNRLSFNQMLNAYEKKYNNNLIMALKSLFYFDEVNHSEPIQMVGNTYNWKMIIKRLKDMQNQPNRIFSKH